MQKLKDPEIWAGLAMLMLGMAFLFLLIPYGVDEPRKVRFAALSPSYYPKIVAFCLSLLGVVVTAKACTSPVQDLENDPTARPDAKLRIFVIFCVIALLAVLLPWLGFVLGGIITLAGTLWFAGERRYWLIAILSVSLPLALYFFFLKVASIPIPLGVLTPLLAGV